MHTLKIKDFNLDHTLSCGQVFRWHKHENYWYGFINRKIVKIKQIFLPRGGKLRSMDEESRACLCEIPPVRTILQYSGRASEKDITAYFNLDLDYVKVIRTFPPNRILIGALKKYWGLRIIKQEPFECLISYILSSQNNIKRINKMVNELSFRFGKKITFEGREYHTFPTLNDLKGCCRSDLNSCRLGFRDKFLDDAVKKLCSKEVRLEKISKMTYPKAMDELMKIKGIGKKVASCILLFGYNRYEAFPVDVWIERVMRKYFPGKDASYFGKYAGYAQEFLYMSARSR